MIYNVEFLDSKNPLSEQEETRTSRFFDHILRHLLKGIRAKEKLVRYRICQFIAMILNELQEIE
jgi:condensin complex subunit 3